GRLACGKPGCECARALRAGHGLTHCPAHADEHPSLSVSERDGKPLWNCKSGCSQEAVTQALKELLPDVEHRNGSQPAPVRRSRHMYDVCDVGGHLVARHVRIELVGGKKK